MRPPLPYGYWVDMELRKEEARTEFIRRGFSTNDLVQIESGDWFSVISARKRRVWMRAVS